MSFAYLTDPGHGPQWQGVLPRRPEAFFLQRGEGEHAMLFTDLLSGDETGGQLIPAHNHHGTHEVFYVVDGSVRVYVAGPDGTKRARRLGPGAAAQAHDMEFLPDFDWSDAQG
jgi:quercetin 2,3-dioxygenase